MSQSVNSGIHLFTFLGTGNYEPAEYKWALEEKCGTSISSRFIQAVITDVLSHSHFPVDKVTVFLTPKARDKHFVDLKESLRTVGFEGRLQDVDIPNGETEDELWELFKVLFKEISETNHTKVAFDITHGFRALPWFMASVVCFLAATGELPSSAQVFYGQWDREHPEDATLINLSPALDVVTWGFGLAQFIQQGRWNESLSEYLREHTKSLNAKLRARGEKSRDFFNGLDSRLREVSDALAVIRTGELILENPKHERTAALPGLLHQLEACKVDVEEHLPPLAVMLDKVSKKFEKFKRDEKLHDLSTVKGLEQLRSLAVLYREWNRLPEATTVLREAFTTLFTAESRAASPHVHRGGETSFRTEGRSIADKRCNEWMQQGPNRGLFDFRNDINHAGFNKQPQNKADLTKSFDTALTRFDEVSQDLEKFRRPFFLNISNHPRSEWCASQLEAAQDLAPQILDIPFPQVEPKLSDKKFDKLVKTFFEDLDKQGLIERSSHAMVMGDFAMTFALVERLKKANIECWVTTSDRRDANQLFQFGQFRRI